MSKKTNQENEQLDLIDFGDKKLDFNTSEPTKTKTVESTSVSSSSSESSQLSTKSPSLPPKLLKQKSLQQFVEEIDYNEIETEEVSLLYQYCYYYYYFYYYSCYNYFVNFIIYLHRLLFIIFYKTYFKN